MDRGRFEASYARGRLAGTYLFVGPPGVGKHRFALALAQALLCERQPSGPLTACGACDACKQVAARSHPDLILVDSSLGVDAVDETAELLATCPTTAHIPIVRRRESDPDFHKVKRLGVTVPSQRPFLGDWWVPRNAWTTWKDLPMRVEEYFGEIEEYRDDG